MQFLPTLLFLLLLFSSCDTFHPERPVKLTFQQLGKREKERITADSLFEGERPQEVDFLRIKIQNRVYDSLYIPAQRLGNDLFFVPNGYNIYLIEGDSLILFESSFPTHCGLDTVVCLPKSQSADLIFAGRRCSDSKIACEYDCIFLADSAGQKINLQFRQFPYGDFLPKRSE